VETGSVVEKLSLQVDALQEGFDVLSNSNSLKNMAKQFAHLLMGNLLTTNIALFLRKTETSEWKELFNKNIDSEKALKKLNHIESDGLLVVTDSKYQISISLTLADKSNFSIWIGKKLNNTAFSESDRLMIQIYLQLFNNAYQAYLSRQKEKELLFSQNKRILQLNSLIDTGIEISKLQRNRSLLKLALERAASLTDASKAMLTVRSKGKIVKRIKFPHAKIAAKEIENSENKISAKFIRDKNEYQLILADKESRRGITSFDSTDELLLDAFASQVDASLENVLLHKTAIERENIKRELDVAASIQQKILPVALPDIEGYDIAGNNIPSKEVGGDYYDVIKLNDGRFALIIADVAGKGVPASLLVSTLNASLTAYLDLQVPLSELAVKINSIIYKSSTGDKFITFFIAVLNPATGELDIVNAGHNPSLLLRNDGTMQKIEAGGIAFGMFDMGLPFAGEKLTMEKGERLFLYTDGIPEAMDKNDNEYSDEKMEEFFKNNKPANASKFIDSIFNDVKIFTGSAPQSDDITALYLIRK
jgi:sigma-B regulation protein RsbU (phosphoserine phosphatase)